MTSFSVTFSNVLLALLFMLPGFLICKCKKVNPDHMGTTSVILLYICSPCMFINALLAPEPSPDLPGKMALFILISFIGEIAMMLILRLICRRISASGCCPSRRSWETWASSACRSSAPFSRMPRKPGSIPVCSIFR